MRRQIFHKEEFHGKDVEPEELTLQKSELELVRWMLLSECKGLVRENGFKHCICEEERKVLPH